MIEQISSGLKETSSRRGILSARAITLMACLALNVLCPPLAVDTAAAAGDNVAQSLSIEARNTPQDTDASLPESIKQQIMKNWTRLDFPPDIDGNFQLNARIELDRTGGVVGTPAIKIVSGHLSRKNSAAVTAKLQKVLQLSSPFKGLPADRYHDWSVITLNLEYVKN